MNFIQPAEPSQGQSLIALSSVLGQQPGPLLMSSLPHETLGRGTV